MTYILQIKDRHNGNILLDRDGHLVHIDFGFMLSNTPGNIGFEAAPFKFPAEYMEVLGGINGSAFLEFKALFRQGFELARKHCDRIISTFLNHISCDLSLTCPLLILGLFLSVGRAYAKRLVPSYRPLLCSNLLPQTLRYLALPFLGVKQQPKFGIDSSPR